MVLVSLIIYLYLPGESLTWLMAQIYRSMIYTFAVFEEVCWTDCQRYGEPISDKCSRSIFLENI